MIWSYRLENDIKKEILRLRLKEIETRKHNERLKEQIKIVERFKQNECKKRI